MNDFKIHSDVLTQYKKLTSKEEKLFYYAYGKFYMKLKAIMNKNEIDDYEDVDWGGMVDYSVNIDYDEIKCLCGVKRVDKNNFSEVEDKLIKGSSTVKIMDEKYNVKILFLYDEVYFDNDSRKVRIILHENIKRIMQYFKNKKYTRVLVQDLNNIKKNYDLKLYLYSLTVYREKNKKGIIKMKLSEMRNILSPDSKIPDNKFYTRFISDPCKRINNNQNLSMKVNCKREKDNIILSVVKRKLNQ